MKRRYGLRFGTVPILAGLALWATLLGCSTASTPTAERSPEGSAAASAAPVATQPATAEAPAHVAPSAIASDPHADARRDSWPVIACFGDSLTAGHGLEPEQSYPADLQRMLDEGGYHYRVVNAGVSGDTTKDGVERVGRVVAGKPKIVVLEFGGNDGLRGLPVETARRNLSAMIERLQRSGAKVALAGISLPPQYGGDYISQFDAMYPALAKQFHLPLLPFMLQDVWGVEGDIQQDGVHPTAQGAKQVAANVEKLIRPMLRKPESGKN